jgi:hypothetical protein
MPTIATRPTPPPADVNELDAALESADRAVEAARQTYIAEGERILALAVAAVKLMQGDRRGTVSAASHIAAEMGRGGPADLDALERDLSDRPHLFTVAARALPRAEQEIEHGHWRNGTPTSEETLARSLVEWNSETAAQLGTELGRAGYNVFHLAALAFRRVGRRQPDLFGRKTREAAGAEVNTAKTTKEKALATFRARRSLLTEFCEIYDVRMQPNVDSAQDLLDAAVAAAQ